ncbi:hypothetical protein BKA69DRAFT_1077814 [Paraphysoderma sedebokerense]|nr:hypothetical protein BKA69DRAFT_1077814 [Paraphysoderma sedebokerense]
MNNPDNTPLFTSATYQNPEAPKNAATLGKVEEVGATSAPLLSASFFIGAKCKEYNEDFMLCKNENPDPKACLKEGRKVTRCAIDLLKRLKANCASEYEAHWKCLDVRNQEFQFCRNEERKLNECVFDKLGLEKHIPDTPKGEVPIHLKKNPIHT